MLIAFVLSSGYIDAYYRKAQAARAILRHDYDKAFESCDVIAFPTTLSPAFKFGEKSDPLLDVSRRHLHRHCESHWYAGNLNSNGYD